MSVFKKLFGREKSQKAGISNELVAVAAPVNQASGNPFLNAKQEWLERHGDYIAQASTWRSTAWLLLLISLISISGNVIQAMQYKTIPYVVSVDSLGNTHSVGVARGILPSEVPKEVIQSDLSNFIINWRSVTADADLQNRMLTKLIAFSSSATQTTLQDWFNQNNPFKRAGSILVSVELKGLPQKVSDYAWRVEWLESVRDRKGKVMEQTSYEATLTVGINPPTSEAEILANPMGVIVADVYFNKLLQQQ
ncbi:MAG: type IV secretion system protein [Deltaproteobacteria bacterium]|jgi:type IV secretion system protein VirB5|nr:type IV secretion system protein [Deltaproteobacteria bacterium]